MGSGSWDSSSWKAYSATHITDKSADRIYTASRLNDKYDPAKVSIRESRDNPDHPNSTPIIIGLDVTGSMSRILESVAAKLGDLVQGILDKKPVSDPQIMFAAIGDTTCDHAPLQVTQFESDIRIAEQIKDVWFERGGGGNSFESYPVIWEFARSKIVTDAFEKRGKKGFIFTMGDDGYPTSLKADHLKRFLGIDSGEDVSVSALLDVIHRKWEVYHLCLEQGGTYSSHDYRLWQGLLGERALTVSDYRMIPEVIISTLQSVAGVPLDDIVNGWDGTTQVVIRKAIEGLSRVSSKATGVVKL